MGNRVKDKVVIVTGGAMGIGKADVELLAADGAKVILVDVDDAGETVAGKLDNVEFHRMDVSQEASWDKLIKHVMKKYGRLDGLVNNAGIDTTSLVKDMPVQLWDQMMAVNLRGVFLPTRAVLPGMIKQKFGRIINIASQLAHKGAPLMAHYCASKAGVIGFTKSLAYEVARDGITVNAICPGPIDTALFRAFPEEWKSKKLAEVPLGRLGTAKEIAPTAVMLAADDGGYYLGATLNPNGGDVMI